MTPKRPPSAGAAGAAPGERQTRALRRKLLAWYDRERRDLPWRARPSAYKTVVSEFMLQQTQVATVVPFFERFLRQFPTMKSLAEATEADVLAAWSGLGYYRRARFLKRAAETIARRHRGRLPREAAALLALPGFGDYTAAAVGSIAFGLPIAAIDGNVRRVLARLFAIGGESESKRIRDAADRLLDAERPGDWNQAVMELGALVCAPREPRCLLCPLRANCRAFAEGRIAQFPAAKKLPATLRVEEVAVAAIRRGRALVLQRGEGGAFAGMWELPRLDSRERPAEELSPEGVLFELTRLRAGACELIGETGTTFTHHRIRTRLYRATSLRAGSPRRQRHIASRWAPLDRLKELPAGKAQRRLFEMLQARPG